MTNLFQLGPTEAAINLGQLLRRKVVIESVSCSDIRWGTPRAASGALPEAAAGAAAGGAKSGGGLALPGLEQLGFDPAGAARRRKGEAQEPGGVRAGQRFAQGGLRRAGRRV